MAASTVAPTALAGCSLGRPHPTLSELRAIPAAELTHPGATIEVHRAADSNRKNGGNPAFYGEIALTDAAPDQVIAYYKRTLAGQGWQQTYAGGSSYDDWQEVVRWTLGPRVFQLGILTGGAADRYQRGGPRTPSAAHRVQHRDPLTTVT